MKKQKYYTIWKGKKTGVFDSWDECKLLVEGYDGARYKSFMSKIEAEKALKWKYEDYIERTQKSPNCQATKLPSCHIPSISVDGAWNTVTGDCEYQWVDTETRKVLFHQWAFKDGTNNIVEFLALVHALAYCHERKLSLPIYSDSKTALSWVRKKQTNTKQVQTEDNKRLFELMRKAVNWLETHDYTNPLLKWETENWGEIPADFGRK